MTIVDFKLGFPVEGWEDQTIYTFKGPTVDERDHYLYLAIDRTLIQDTIKKFATSKADIITENLSDLTVLRNEEITIPKGNPAWEFIVEWAPSDKWSCYKKYVFVLFDNRGFTFNIDFSRKSYELVNRDVKAIIDSYLPGTYSK